MKTFQIILAYVIGIPMILFFSFGVGEIFRVKLFGGDENAKHSLGLILLSIFIGIIALYLINNILKICHYHHY